MVKQDVIPMFLKGVLTIPKAGNMINKAIKLIVNPTKVFVSDSINDCFFDCIFFTFEKHYRLQYI